MALRTARVPAWTTALGAFAALGLAASAHATTQVDGTNDFLAAYTGPPVAYEDVISVSARISGGNIFLDATMNGAIDATAQANAEGKHLLPDSVVKIRDQANARKLADARKLLAEFLSQEGPGGGER